MLLTSRCARGTGLALLVLILADFAGCQRSEAPPPPAAPLAVARASPDDAAALLLPDLMSFLVDPAAGVVLAAAAADPMLAAEPRSGEAWQAVVDAAVQLAQTGRDLALPALALERADWLRWAAAVRDGATASGAAATQRDDGALALAGRNIHAACQSCHARYAPDLAEPSAERLPVRARAALSG